MAKENAVVRRGSMESGLATRHQRDVAGHRHVGKGISVAEGGTTLCHLFQVRSCVVLMPEEAGMVPPEAIKTNRIMFGRFTKSPNEFREVLRSR